MADRAAQPRTPERRKQDVLTRLTEDQDVWVATADPAGEPCLVPLCFLWWGETLLMSTRAGNPTARNIDVNGRATLSLGHTRDVVLIEATAESVAPEAVDAAEAAAFKSKMGWEATNRPDWAVLRFRPLTVRAWREANELRGRQLMRDGQWLV
ncbi:pyridoxamine 5'-phosphate oxidase family protein [Streptomyces profundus]|uniref:pyridoxamine 5'-phosphate oxidase family protein n=1 Tax=Streptomyces profundus TaxID=2867410 RepID=UPI001D16926A|nr:pyridoxamine 5'-phosphate oxidase family protein [Streptomyces sp. MA3_2.13]UED88626.1 pyridoxamine 5'-phosphate oxidase family protein [Streptomyces sp. MA3_2.13]